MSKSHTDLSRSTRRARDAKNLQMGGKRPALQLIFYLLKLLVCLILLIQSGAVLIYFYAFASMVDPSLQGAARWRVVLGKMFGMYEGVVSIPMLLIFVGSFLMLLWFTLSPLFIKTCRLASIYLKRPG